jgi:hypothetical protein
MRGGECDREKQEILQDDCYKIDKKYVIKDPISLQKDKHYRIVRTDRNNSERIFYTRYTKDNLGGYFF